MNNAGEGLHGPDHRHALDFSDDAGRQRKPIVST
jgi:hypothetical protein